jgi:hypothetical protein
MKIICSSETFKSSIIMNFIMNFINSKLPAFTHVSFSFRILHILFSNYFWQYNSYYYCCYYHYHYFYYYYYYYCNFSLKHDLIDYILPSVVQRGYHYDIGYPFNICICKSLDGQALPSFNTHGSCNVYR